MGPRSLVNGSGYDAPMARRRRPVLPLLLVAALAALLAWLLGPDPAEVAPPAAPGPPTPLPTPAAAPPYSSAAAPTAPEDTPAVDPAATGNEPAPEGNLRCGTGLPDPPFDLDVRIVAAEDGSPLAAGAVEALDGAGLLLRRVGAPDGEVRLAGLPGDAASIVARAPARLRTVGAARPPESGGPLVLALPLAPGVLAGDVRAAEDGSPVGAAAVLAFLEVTDLDDGTPPDALPPWHHWTADGPPLARAATDGSGAFRLDGLPAEAFVRVEVTAPGRVSAVAAFRLRAGRCLDPPAFRLERAALLHVRVLLPDGSPAEGADVRALPADLWDGERRAERWPLAPRDTTLESRRARTDGNGAATLDGLPLGALVVVAAERADLLPANDAMVVVSPDAPSAAVELRLRRSARVEVRLAAAGGLDRAALREAEVALVGTHGARESPDDAGDVPAVEGPPAAAEPDLHVFSAAGPGPWDVLVRAPGAAPVLVPVEVIEGETLRVDVALEPAVFLVGVVVDDRGEPVPFATIRVEEPGWPRAARILHHGRAAEADGDGRFRMEGLPRGALHLVAGARLHAPRAPVAVDAPATALRVVADRQASVRLRARLPARGRVGAVVEVERSSAGVSPRDPSRDLDLADDDGVTVTGIDPGPNRITLTVQGLGRVVLPVDLAPGEERDLGDVVFERGQDLEGLVRTADGRPLPGVRVFTRPAAADGAVTDAEGAFRVPGAPGGEVEVWIEGADVVPQFWTVALPNGGRRVLLVPDRGGRFTGHLRRADGTPVTGRLLLYEEGASRDGPPRARADTDARGAFAVRVPSGRWTVEVWDLAEESLLTTADGEVVEGGDAVVEITVP